MKKIIILIFALTLTLIITACSESKAFPEAQGDDIIESTTAESATVSTTQQPTASELLTDAAEQQTTTKPQAIDPIQPIVIRDDDFGVGQVSSQGGDVLCWTFTSLDTFSAFVQRSEESRLSGTKSEYLSRSNYLSSASAIKPKKLISGLELININYMEERHISYLYKLSNYVYDNKLSESDNSYLSLATYEVNYSTLDGGRERLNWFEQRDNWIPLSERDGSVVYYGPGYFSDTDSELLVCHMYVFIAENKSVYARLPVIDGLSEYDMLKYLDMVKVQ